MHTDLFVQISPTFPECSVLVDNLEAFVREAETRMVKDKPEASWFEEYVSSLVAVQTCYEACYENVV